MRRLHGAPRRLLRIWPVSVAVSECALTDEMNDDCSHDDAAAGGHLRRVLIQSMEMRQSWLRRVSRRHAEVLLGAGGNPKNQRGVQRSP